MPNKIEDEDSEEGDERVKEITNDQAAEIEGTLVVDAYVAGASRNYKAALA